MHITAAHIINRQLSVDDMCSYDMCVTLHISMVHKMQKKNHITDSLLMTSYNVEVQKNVLVIEFQYCGIYIPKSIYHMCFRHKIGNVWFI